MADDIGTYFADRQMFTTDPNWLEEIGSRFQVQRRLLGYGYTASSLVSLNTDAPINLDLNFQIDGHESKYNLLDFFNSRKLKIESFWYMHPARLFTLQQTYLSGGGYLRCERNYSHLWTQGLPSQYDWGVYIRMRNGDLITRKVTGITDSESPSYSAVFLDETIPRDINLANHYMIGRMLVGRFDDDDVVLQMQSNTRGVASVKLQENYRSFSSWSVSSTSKESVSSTTVSSESSDSSESSRSNSSYSKQFQWWGF